MMNLQEKHPLLFDFFAGYFPEADLDGLTDEQVVDQFILNNNNEIIEKTKKQLSSIDFNDDFLLKNIINEANRYFETTEEILDWLKMILKRF